MKSDFCSYKVDVIRITMVQMRALIEYPYFHQYLHSSGVHLKLWPMNERRYLRG